MIQKIVIGVIVVILIIFTIRFLTPEDNWICSRGEWVKHGNPSSPKPVSTCR